MPVPRTWFKVEEFRLDSLSLVSFGHLSVLVRDRLISYIDIYHLFAEYYILSFSLQLRAGWNFRLWRLNLIFSDTEMKELGRSTQINIHNTRSLIRTSQVYLRHLAVGRSLHGGRYKHTHTHTHTHAHAPHTYTWPPNNFVFIKVFLINFYRPLNLKH